MNKQKIENSMGNKDLISLESWPQLNPLNTVRSHPEEGQGKTTEYQCAWPQVPKSKYTKIPLIILEVDP